MTGYRNPHHSIERRSVAGIALVLLRTVMEGDLS